MDKIVIDLADPNTRSLILMGGIAWAVGVLVTLYSLVSDVAELRASRKGNTKH